MRTLLLAFLLTLSAFVIPPAFAQDANNIIADNAAEAVGNGINTTTETPPPPRQVQQGQQSGAEPEVFAGSGRALLKLFMFAVLLESALALLFNWRPFVAVFDGRGVKSIISLVAALAVTFILKPDAVAALLAAYGQPLAEGSDALAFSRVVEAMVIAGGSAGVNNMLRALGFRAVTRAEDVAPTPPKDEAWYSVGLRRRAAVGPVEVEIKRNDDTAWRAAGTIIGTLRKRSFLSYFVRDFARFPASGGRVVPPGEPIALRLAGKNAEKEDIFSVEWGPKPLDKRAVVDIELEL